MNFSVIRTQSEFETIAGEWNQLLEKSASHVPFLQYEYLATWWQTLGGGEWKAGELLIVIARDDDGKLIGGAPLFSTENLDGKQALMLLGSIEISDYLDLLATTENLPNFIENLLPFLASPDVGGSWEILDLYNFLIDSPTLPQLEAASKTQGWHYTQEIIQPAPSIALANTWDEYLLGIKKKQRHEIRRKIRRAENHIVPVRWYIVTDEATLEAEIEAFLQLMAHDAEKAAFLTDVMQTQMRTAVQTAFREGWLQLAFLEVGAEKAAAYLNFDYANRIWVYNSGIDPKFRELSPGWVLAGYLIQWAIENGRAVFDFMRGDEIYKYRLGGVNRHVLRVQITRK
jgi:CelD/BcsL family acetyltransferase involved in cellulose biosynthesis